MKVDVKCKNCKHYKPQSEELHINYGSCNKLYKSKKIDFLINAGEEVVSIDVDEDFYCYHFEIK